MKIVTILFLSLFCFACTDINRVLDVKTISDTTVTIEKVERHTPPPPPIDSVTWINSFRDFRTAVYEKNLSKVKSFINFPIMNEGNEIWYLTDKDPDKEMKGLTDEIKPFTEKHFDDRYQKIFPKTFVNSILKIKTDSLFRNGEFETVELLADGLNYKTMASVNKEKNQLVLNMAYYSPKNAIKEDEEGVEYNVIYYFDILPNNQIKFKQIKMAG